MATLFIHSLANIEKEIMPKNLGGAGNDFTVKMSLVKHLIDISAVTMHLCGKPFHRSALLIENRFDNMSYMEIRHLCKNIVNYCLRWRFGKTYCHNKKAHDMYTRAIHFLGDKDEIFPIFISRRKAKTPFLLFMMLVCYCFIQSWLVRQWFARAKI